MPDKSLITNLFKGDANFSAYGTIADNGRAKIVKADNRILIVIDGVTYSASRTDLFGMNEKSPETWINAFVTQYDKKAKEKEFNAPLEARAERIKDKIAENREKVKDLEAIKEAIKEAIHNVTV